MVALRLEPLLDHPLIEFIGESGDREKEAFLGQALALLFPIDWPEPFGLVMIEAMAVGTPVIAWRNGSVPEVIENGHTGLIVESIGQAVDAVRNVQGFDRLLVRRQFERRFTVTRMAKDYLAVYRRLLGAGAETLVAQQLEDFAVPTPELASPALQGDMPCPSKLAHV